MKRTTGIEKPVIFVKYDTKALVGSSDQLQVEWFYKPADFFRVQSQPLATRRAILAAHFGSEEVTEDPYSDSDSEDEVEEGLYL